VAGAGRADVSDWTLPPARTLTGPEAAGRAGLPYELAQRLWRALGMPEVGAEVAHFDERDVEALVSLRTLLDLGVPLEELVAITRLAGRSFARMARAEVDVLERHVLDDEVKAALKNDPEGAIGSAAQLLLAATFAPLLDARRHHVVAALGDRLGAERATDRLTIGFADLVDFSRLSEHLGEDSLGTVVTRFEDVALGACTDHGSRLVKMIGDAAMFAAAEAGAALTTAETIVSASHDDEFLPEARAGLDTGDVLVLAGDYFGRTVNVAARVTAFARPGTVVVTRAVVDELPGLETSHIGHQRLKGVGEVELFKVRRARSNDHKKSLWS
jgi:adenylate cyclase